MKKKNNYLGLLVAIILVVILSNPSILPLPTSFIASVKDTMSNSMPFVVFDNNILAKLIVLLLMLSVMYDRRGPKSCLQSPACLSQFPLRGECFPGNGLR